MNDLKTLRENVEKRTNVRKRRKKVELFIFASQVFKQLKLAFSYMSAVRSTCNVTQHVHMHEDITHVHLATVMLLLCYFC